MNLVCKVAKSLKYMEYLNPVSRVIANSIRNEYKRNVHTSQVLGFRTYKRFYRTFVAHENLYAYSIMENKGYAVKLKAECQVQVVQIAKEQFNQLIHQDWSKKTTQELFKLLPALGAYCSEHGLCISNTIFDSYVANLTASIKHASNDELTALFRSLMQWPETVSVRTRNYVQVWAALDDECLKRHLAWSVDETLSYLTLFYLLNLTRVGNFPTKGLQRITNEVKQLTPEQLVHSLFFISSNRKAPHDMHNIEKYLDTNFSKLSIDELAVVAMGFFKSKTPMRSVALLEKIIDKIIVHSSDVHEVSLAALLKVIRYSMKADKNNKVYQLLDALQHEVPRLSIMCKVHIALVGTAMVTLHKGCLSKVAESLINTLSEARIKDLERLVFTFGTFNHRPDTKECFFQKVLDELRKVDREPEFNLFARAYARTIAFLGMLNIYPVDLMDKVLNPEFLLNTYGKLCQSYGKEVLTIQNTSDIYCAKETKMHKLTTKQVTILGQKYIDHRPSEGYFEQYTYSEKMLLDVMGILKEKRGEDCVTDGHVVTHHQRADIIICNSHDGRPLPVADAFNTSIFGGLREPPDDNRWIVIVIAARNGEIRNTGKPTGPLLSKLRDLRALGYHAALVSWSKYSRLQSAREKAYYLNELIIDSLKSKS